MTILSASDLTVSFDGAHAVRDACVTLERGERLGIIGESGCGKSMLGLALAGMTPEAARVSGSIVLDGRDMSGARERDWRTVRGRTVAMVFQEPMAALNPLLRIGDTLREPLQVHEGMTRSQANRQALDLLAEVGIDDPAARLLQYPHQISGGQRQRVLIALALACNPSLLIADEPTTALDATVAQRIIQLLVSLSQSRRMALVFISHDLGAVARATQRMIVMYGGDMVERGETAAILEEPAHPYTQGLVAARPRLDLHRTGRTRLPTIPGSVPPLVSLPDGCRFAGRCPVELPHCATRRPPKLSRSGGEAACYRLVEREEAS